jgi:hypothetical protein
MRLDQFKNALVSVAVVALIIGCVSNLAPLHNVESQPISASRAVSLDEVGKAIIRAGASISGFQMKQVKPGLITATYARRGLSAVMEIKYDTKQYSIAYKDSQGLQYDGAQIHKTYNGWVQRLDGRIKAQLSQL